MRPQRKFSFEKNVFVVNDSNKESIVEEEIGKEPFSFITEHANVYHPQTFITSSTNHFNIRSASSESYQTIINLSRINDVKQVNSFMSAVNEKLYDGGVFIGCAETEKLRRKRFLNKFVFPLNHIYCFFDFTFKRVFPKLPITRKIYFFVTGGRNRAMSKVEIFGRLYRSGFEIDYEKEINSLHYFVVRKIKKPLYDTVPSHYPIIKLKRVGQYGNIINVYKLRTMHSYSEYLQAYIYKMNNIDNGGKFKDDFRISALGKTLRKLWIDELPMLLNLVKGEVKLFGVRPLSNQYYNLYSEELKKERIKYKPGLIPPYYVDLPKNLDEIMASEKKYLELYSKNPFKTNFKYMTIALYNIIIRGKRSK